MNFNEVISLLLSAEPPAVEGLLHGGARRRFQETPPRLPLHRPAALHQAEETGCRVSPSQATRKVRWFKVAVGE